MCARGNSLPERRADGVAAATPVRSPPPLLRPDGVRVKVALGSGARRVILGGPTRHNGGDVTVSQAHLELVFKAPDTFPVVADSSRYHSARIYQRRFRFVAGGCRLENLRKLEIVGYPDASLDPLGDLIRLEHLSILHLPAWRRGSKPIRFGSLSPLSALPVLEEVNLFGLELTDRFVTTLAASIPTLRRARLADYRTRRHLSLDRTDGDLTVAGHPRPGVRGRRSGQAVGLRDDVDNTAVDWHTAGALNGTRSAVTGT